MSNPTSDQQDGFLDQLLGKSKTLAKLLPEGLLVIENGIVIYANLAAEKMLGYPSDALRGKALEELSPEKESPATSIPLHRGSKIAEPIIKECTVRCLDGTIKPVLWHVQSYTDEASGRAGTLCTLTDLGATLEARENLQNLFIGSADAIFVESLDGTILDVNPAACALHNLNRDELVGENVLSLIPPEHREQAKEEFDRFVSGGMDYLESYAYTYGRQKVPVGIRVAKITYGRQDALLFTVRNISKRKAVEQTLQARERELRAFWENSQSLLCTHDMKGNLLSINEYGARMFGAPAESLIQQSLHTLVAAGKDGDFSSYLTRIRRDKQASGVLKINARNGEERYWAYHNVIFQPQDGDPLVIGSGVDMTDRYIMEKELASSNRISELNIERLHKTLRELEEAKKQIEANSKARQEFLATVSHEIRTPLNAILGFAELLSDTKMDGDQTEYLGAVKSAGDNLMVLINDLLDLSKIEAGMLTLSNTTFNLRKVIKDTHAIFQPAFEQKNISYQLDLAANLPETVTGDPHRLQQILSNLVANAAKFTPSGKVEISAWLESEENDYRLIGFKVTDSGIGISKMQQKDIFDNFVQATADTARRFGGTGLGLAIVRQLVQLQNGKIDLSSTPGEGSTFSFTIEYAASNQAPITPVEVRKDLAVELEGKRILLADDNELNLRLATKALEATKCLVTAVSNGKEAVRAATRNTFDLILLDIRMPEMDGLEAARVLSSELGLKCPLIALTADAFVEHPSLYKEAGFTDHLTKPFRRADLVEMLVRSLALGDEQEGLSSSSSQMQKTIDLTDLIALSANDEGFVREMLLLFLDHCAPNMAELRQLLEQEDYVTLGALAHKLRTSYGSLGISQGQKLLEGIERGAKFSPNAAELAQHLDSLTAVNTTAIREVMTYLASDETAPQSL